MSLTPPPFVPSSPPLTLPPTTTLQEDITTHGQRRINLIWEVTQAIVAISITVAVIYSSANGMVSADLSNGFFLIIGFYFSRTNHQAIGGVGMQSSQDYIGR